VRLVIRWGMNAVLIYEVARGRTWALVTLLILMSLGHEATAFILRKNGLIKKAEL